MTYCPVTASTGRPPGQHWRPDHSTPLTAYFVFLEQSGRPSSPPASCPPPYNTFPGADQRPSTVTSVQPSSRWVCGTICFNLIWIINCKLCSREREREREGPHVTLKYNLKTNNNGSLSRLSSQSLKLSK